MRPLRNVARRLRSLFDKPAVESDLDRELRFHLDQETQKNIGLGMAPDEARRAAHRSFGSVEVTKEAHRDGRGTRLLEEALSDARYGLRALRRAPVLAATAIVTLALGIGANTAIFSAVNAVILRPLPFTDPDRLVMLWESNPERHWVNETAAPANVLDWGEQVKSFEEIGSYASFTNSSTLTGVGEPRQLTSVQVTGNFFRMLGVRPELGQTFRDEETWRTGEATAVLSHRVWRGVFGADSQIIGRVIKLYGRDVRVVGVLPASFAIPGLDADIFRPTAFDPAQRTQVAFRRAHWLRPIARLRPSVTQEQANAEFQAVIKRLEQDFPVTNTRMGGGFTPLHAFLVGDTQRPLLVLLGAVALLLLIACANIGNLLLVQAAGRTREMSVRLALGAGRARLIRQALTESLVLSALGGSAGFLLGWWNTRLLSALRPAGLLPTGPISMSWTVLAYVTLLTTMSGLLFGLAPALWNRRRAPADVLREGGRAGTSGGRARRWGETLLIAEVAIALLLTIGAGLVSRSLWKLERVDSGLDANGVLTAAISLPGIRYDSIRKVEYFWNEVTRRARDIPGVTGAGAVSLLPLTLPSWSSDFTANGWTPDKFGVDVLHREATQGYFEAMHVPVLKGRGFLESDVVASEQVAIINDAIARRYFPNEDPIGKRITFNRVADSASIWRTVVGVVGNERQSSLATPPREEIFAPALQWGRCCLTLVVRTSGDPAALTPAIRQVVASLDPNLALASVRTMASVRAESAARQRFLTLMLFAFALVGLTLAIVGVYGVMAQVARGRSREMGIRIALGAQPGAVEWLVIRRGLMLTGIGIGAGLIVALPASRALRALLFDVQAVDPLTYIAVPALLAGAAAAACWIPARRASGSDPAGTLRLE